MMFDIRVPIKSYRTLMDMYKLTVYVFIFAIMIQNTRDYLEDWEYEELKVHRLNMALRFGGALLAIHVDFLGLALQSYVFEHRKLDMCYHEVKKHNEHHGPRPKFKAIARTASTAEPFVADP